MRPGRARLIAGVLTVATLTASCGGGPDGPPTGWSEGEQRGRWTLVYSGYGDAGADDTRVRLGPQAAADHDITHGALAVDAAAPADLRLTGRVTTVDQVREGTPNPWEVGWLLWRYTDPDHFYAVALKPNGWELSKQDPSYPGKQRFLASGDTPAQELGTPADVEVVAVGDTMTVKVGHTVLATVTDTERPYRTGGVGLYTEDAVVDFDDVRTEPASALPGWASEPVPARKGTGRGGAADGGSTS